MLVGWGVRAVIASSTTTPGLFAGLAAVSAARQNPASCSAGTVGAHRPADDASWIRPAYQILQLAVLVVDPRRPVEGRRHVTAVPGPLCADVG